MAKSVESGAFDAGVVNYTTYEDMVRGGDLDPERCIKLWETPPYPDYHWTAHPSLDSRFGDGFTDRLQEALVSITDVVLLDALQRPDGLIAANNSDFEKIEAICAKRGLVER